MISVIRHMTKGVTDKRQVEIVSCWSANQTSSSCNAISEVVWPLSAPLGFKPNSTSLDRSSIASKLVLGGLCVEESCERSTKNDLSCMTGRHHCRLPQRHTWPAGNGRPGSSAFVELSRMSRGYKLKYAVYWPVCVGRRCNTRLTNLQSPWSDYKPSVEVVLRVGIVNRPVRP